MEKTARSPDRTWTVFAAGACWELWGNWLQILISDISKASVYGGTFTLLELMRHWGLASLLRGITTFFSQVEVLVHGEVMRGLAIGWYRRGNPYLEPKLHNQRLIRGDWTPYDELDSFLILFCSWPQTHTSMPLSHAIDLLVSNFSCAFFNCWVRGQDPHPPSGLVSPYVREFSAVDSFLFQWGSQRSPPVRFFPPFVFLF